MKKPTDEYINSKRRRMSSNHQEFGGQSLDFSGIGAGLVSGGRSSSSNPFAAGGGFQHEGANAPNVIDLLDEDSGVEEAVIGSGKAKTKAKAAAAAVPALVGDDEDDARSVTPSQSGRSQSAALAEARGNTPTITPKKAEVVRLGSRCQQSQIHLGD